MKSVVALVNWYGPYSLDEALPASFDYDDGVYMLLGRRPYERQIAAQYMGLASSLSRRLNGYHHALGEITKDLQLWLGEVDSPRTPGRKIKVTDRMLDLVEWAHVYFMQLPLNSKKKRTAPDRPITVLNRWWKKDYETRYRKRPHADWPDLIDFIEEGPEVRIVWFGGRQEVRLLSEA